MIYEERPSGSPYIQSIWHVRMDSNGSTILPADSSWQMLVRVQDDQTCLSVQGPTTKAYALPQRAGAEWFGIRFTLSVFMPQLPASDLVNAATTLPEAAPGFFW